ncbi:MAG: glycosyltransferase family A protein [Leptolyngbyaceae bacterium]|nr:glycosyltransferase family A protein [Leptolyngbyaceae bacterium]
MSRLALCIPAYNAADHLPRLLISAQQQTIQFDEIWVYDDASTDDTSQVADCYGARVLRGSINLGCSSAKNALLNKVSSEWIHFHDADDELLPNFTTLAHRWIAKPSCPDVVLFDYEYRDDNSGELLARSAFSPQELEADPVRFAILNQINPFCGLYKTASLLRVDGYDTDPLILYNEDVAFHIKLASNGLSFSAEKEISIINYRMSGSMSQANQVRCLIAHVEVMKRACETLGDRYPMELKKKLWHAAEQLSSKQEWYHMDDALAAAEKLTRDFPVGFSPTLVFFVRLLGDRKAFCLRENLIRILKPQLRRA